jgi:hypothetical protein
MPTDLQPETQDDDGVAEALTGAWAELLIVDYRRRHSEILPQGPSTTTEAYDQTPESEINHGIDSRDLREEEHGTSRRRRATLRGSAGRSRA